MASKNFLISKRMHSGFNCHSPVLDPLFNSATKQNPKNQNHLFTTLHLLTHMQQHIHRGGMLSYTKSTSLISANQQFTPRLITLPLFFRNKTNKSPPKNKTLVKNKTKTVHHTIHMRCGVLIQSIIHQNLAASNLLSANTHGLTAKHDQDLASKLVHHLRSPHVSATRLNYAYFMSRKIAGCLIGNLKQILK